MKIGIVSDSHDHIENITKSVRIFNERDVGYVLHLGDYVNPNSVRAFNGIKLIGIFGNNDGDAFRIINAFNEIGGEIKGDFHAFTEDNLRFACYHGTESRITEALITCGKYDVVLYGHTHKCENRSIGNTLVLNPGTLHGFWNNPTVMVFDTGNRNAEIISLK